MKILVGILTPLQGQPPLLFLLSDIVGRMLEQPGSYIQLQLAVEQQSHAWQSVPTSSQLYQMTTS